MLKNSLTSSTWVGGTNRKRRRNGVQFHFFAASVRIYHRIHWNQERRCRLAAVVQTKMTYYLAILQSHTETLCETLILMSCLLFSPPIPHLWGYCCWTSAGGLFYNWLPDVFLSFSLVFSHSFRKWIDILTSQHPSRATIHQQSWPLLFSDLRYIIAHKSYLPFLVKVTDENAIFSFESIWIFFGYCT